MAVVCWILFSMQLIMHVLPTDLAVLTTVTLLHSQITCDVLKENQPFLYKS